MGSYARQIRSPRDVIGDLCEAAGIDFPRSQAQLLAKRFPTLPDVLAASHLSLAGVPGIDSRTADVVCLTGEVMRQCLRQQWTDAPVLKSIDSLLTYLKVVMAPLPREEVRILFLDGCNRLVLEEVMARGSNARVEIGSRDVIRRALEVSALGLIIVHNHPSGSPAPSKGDLAWTRQLKSAAGLFEIVLIDHLIIGRDGWVSLQETGLV